ncbi:Aspartate ammonia-lyase [Fusarium agapanthi]|uniref:Aspartate ammonia-lyase n=1 Tax=Fusarium agapanthi TaxID=1803897 RepID=A0A9P5BCQ2_9HYPO|nr:Aspartate ammonia-lyase [Fusarium agapanthi]
MRNRIDVLTKEGQDASKYNCKILIELFNRGKHVHALSSLTIISIAKAVAPELAEIPELDDKHLYTQCHLILKETAEGGTPAAGDHKALLADSDSIVHMLTTNEDAGPIERPREFEENVPPQTGNVGIGSVGICHVGNPLSADPWLVVSPAADTITVTQIISTVVPSEPKPTNGLLVKGANSHKVTVTIETKRLEKDSLGQLELPDDVLYGINTFRAIENFPLSGRPIASWPHIIYAFAVIKQAAARANYKVGTITSEQANAIFRGIRRGQNWSPRQAFCS